MTLRNPTRHAAQAGDGPASGRHPQQPQHPQYQQQQPYQQPRHGSAESSGAESYRSTDTVRRPRGASLGSAVRGKPVRLNTARRLQYVYHVFSLPVRPGLRDGHLRWRIGGGGHVPPAASGGEDDEPH